MLFHPKILTLKYCFILKLNCISTSKYLKSFVSRLCLDMNCTFAHDRLERYLWNYEYEYHSTLSISEIVVQLQRLKFSDNQCSQSKLVYFNQSDYLKVITLISEHKSAEQRHQQQRSPGAELVASKSSEDSANVRVSFASSLHVCGHDIKKLCSRCHQESRMTEINEMNTNLTNPRVCRHSKTISTNTVLSSYKCFDIQIFLLTQLFNDYYILS